MVNIEKYESLVKICLTEEEKNWISERANGFLSRFDELDIINTDGIKPLVTVLDVKTVLRKDEIKKNILRDDLLSAAPEQYDGYFQIPKAVE